MGKHQCTACKRTFRTAQGLGLHFNHARKNPTVCDGQPRIDPRDAEIKRLKAEVATLRVDHERAIETLTASGVALDVHSTMSMTTHAKSIVSQVRDLLRENQALRLDLAAHERALAAGPAALYADRSHLANSFAADVEDAQAEAMKEKP